MDIGDRLREVLGKLAGFPNSRLIAVSKGQPVKKIIAAYAHGQRDFGENYVQELLEKSAELQAQGVTDIRWHFIGHLQTNKVKQLLPVVSSIHAVGSERLAREISKRWASLGRTGPLPVFAEVNVDQEPSKSGFSPDEVVAVLPVLGELPGLSWAGLMCVPSREGGRSGKSFSRLVALEKVCRPVTQGELSMGMSEDYEVALREGVGASKLWIRLGTSIFGERPPRSP